MMKLSTSPSRQSRRPECFDAGHDWGMIPSITSSIVLKVRVGDRGVLTTRKRRRGTSDSLRGETGFDSVSAQKIRLSRFASIFCRCRLWADFTNCTHAASQPSSPATVPRCFFSWWARKVQLK